jgi:pilus assembly protein CpaB
MKAARLVVLGVALAAGGIAAYLAAGHRDEAPPAPPPPPLATVEILIAKSDLTRGQTIATGDVDWQIWPAAAANPSFVKKQSRPDAINQYVGAIVRVPVASGEPILDPMVVFQKGSGFMAAILPKGMRAVSMELSAENGAGGFILPDDHVDVVLTKHDKGDRPGVNDKINSESILRNVRVLAIDQTVEEKAGQKVVVGKTATLELTPDEAETLEQARQQGTLSLSLRSLVDSESATPEDDEGGDRKHGPINTVRYGVSTPSTTR